MVKDGVLDYSHIAQQISKYPLIGFGESTHGTHEFFATKAEVFKILVKNYGFNAFFLESIDDHCEAINQYLASGKGDLTKLVKKLFYVYRTNELLDLFKWLRENYQAHPVSVIGLDERKYVDDYQDDYSFEKVNLRDKRMTGVIKRYRLKNPKAKAMIWAHDHHVAAYMNSPELAPAIRSIPMGEHLRNWFGDKYYSIAQLFGSGYFNAALIEESNEFDNSRLVSHYARKPSKCFWENHLGKELLSPVFLEGPDYTGLIKEGEVHYKRALGWGVKRSVMHDHNNVAYVDISKAYDGLIFFPQITASHLLTKKRPE